MLTHPVRRIVRKSHHFKSFRFVPRHHFRRCIRRLSSDPVCAHAMHHDIPQGHLKPFPGSLCRDPHGIGICLGCLHSVLRDSDRRFPETVMEHVPGPYPVLLSVQSDRMHIVRVHNAVPRQTKARYCQDICISDA